MESLLLYINSIKFNRSLVDGPGVRTVVFFQGCDIRCKGCQNNSTWDMLQGTQMTTEELAKILHLKVLNKKITISGGEQLLQSEALLELVKKLKDFDIAVYTGHKLEEVPKELLENIKYIKTGSFIEEKMTTVNPYVGSSNQQFRRLR